MQGHLELIPHKAQGATIYMRPEDGFINATAMCQAAGKLFGHYRENAATKAFLSALSTDIGIPISDLVIAMKGGDARLQGTWVHPQVAINLGQWCSPEFAVKVSQWVYDWMTGRTAPAPTKVVPYHLRRYAANRNSVPAGHFSILIEMTQVLIAPMEIDGYTLPEDMVPDISDGLIWNRYLRNEHGIDTDAFPKYRHRYEDGRVVLAKAYPDSLLPLWRKHFREVWLPQRAIAYFTGRDNDALEYLPKLLPPPAA